VAVVFVVLGVPPVPDVMALTLLTLHDPVDAAWRTVLAIVVEAMSHLSLHALAVMLVNVTAGIATTPFLVKVGT
jgi:threonine/homoserine/homoserine lactone efflux protein